MSTTNDSGIVDHYYSGQGVVLIGLRDATTGNPKALVPVGNVSALKVSVATTVIEHKESHTGQRGIDLRLQTDTKVTAEVTMENFIAANLAMATRGDATTVAAGSVVAASTTGWPGAVTALGKLSVSAASVTGTSALTVYTDATTPYDYTINTDAGSYQLNDPSVTGVATVKLGVTPTAITAGATTVVTAPITSNWTVGDRVYLTGWTGADAASLNGQVVVVTALVASTSFSFTSPSTAAMTLTAGANTRAYNLSQSQALTTSYSYAAQKLIQPLTQGLTDLYLRFEGLNTAASNESVVVEIYRLSIDPTKDLSLISDTVQQFVLSGSVLVDNTKTTGSKYFKAQTLH